MCVCTEMSDFTLDNPGGGAPLLENASCTLVRGGRYGLIGEQPSVSVVCCLLPSLKASLAHICWHVLL